jgi:hypothetical protein
MGRSFVIARQADVDVDWDICRGFTLLGEHVSVLGTETLMDSLLCDQQKHTRFNITERGFMDKAYIVSIIGVLGPLLGTIVGFSLPFAFERVQKKMRVKDDLRSALNKVLTVTVVNKYALRYLISRT